ncbi:MAG: hypothetical protein ACT6Q7_07685 [Blastomonas fulva]|jgi:hypothetical protein|uniref:hypothetical protein n=1 Tax=Blastomonas fulva TaxID=1550728 RepID=UPI003F72F4EC
MSTLSLFAAATAISLLAVIYLLYTDTKRIRVFRLNRAHALPRYRRAGWALAFAPGAGLLALGELSAFLAWCGAITVLAWLVVARTPADDR